MPTRPERGGGKIKRGADRHYGVLSVARMPAVIQACPLWRPAKDAHLYLWATNNYLADAMTLITQLGFRYITTITWVKTRIGLGQYFRGKTEQLLFAVRGNGPKVARKRTTVLSTCIESEHVKDAAGRIVHSAKPPAFHEAIEAASRGPRAELFARTARPGWSSWGDELSASAGRQ